MIHKKPKRIGRSEYERYEKNFPQGFNECLNGWEKWLKEQEDLKKGR